MRKPFLLGTVIIAGLVLALLSFFALTKRGGAPSVSPTPTPQPSPQPLSGATTTPGFDIDDHLDEALWDLNLLDQLE